MEAGVRYMLERVHMLPAEYRICAEAVEGLPDNDALDKLSQDRQFLPPFSKLQRSFQPGVQVMIDLSLPFAGNESLHGEPCDPVEQDSRKGQRHRKTVSLSAGKTEVLWTIISILH